MGFGIKLKVWGDRACFTRPEFKVERVSYDVITPSAARGILDAIYWKKYLNKPAFIWVIDRIHVMNPVEFDNIKRNEIKDGVISKSIVASAFNGNNVELYIDSKSDKYRTQRTTLFIKNICYYIEAHFDMLDQNDSVEKHYNVALRRMKKGQCYYQPYFGCREFPVNFELVDEIPASSMGNKDFGLMLWDVDMAHDKKAIFFRATMNNGIIDVAKCVGESVCS